MPSTQRIIVLGPLRSGTSLTAELVRLWGAHAGPDDQLWKSDPDDPRGYGYMEYVPLQQLNDDLLDGNDRVPPLTGAMQDRASDARFRDRAVNLIQDMDRRAAEAGAAAWVWKDARLPLTLPFWMNFWGDATYVVTVRHPIETILSAARTEDMSADSLPYSAGLLYWQYCMLSVLSAVQSSPRKSFVAYDRLVDEPRRECGRLSRFLGHNSGITDEQAQARVEQMLPQISETQRHFRSMKSLAEFALATREQRSLYDFLRVKTLHPDESFNQDDFALYPGWREYLEAIDALLMSSRTHEA